MSNRPYGRQPADEKARMWVGTNHWLTAWRTERNTVGYSLLAPGGTSCALQNLQSKTFFPGKAKQGWQLQVIDWASAGLHEIKSIA